MSDPFDVLRDELAAAAVRSTTTRHRLGRPLLIAAAVLLSGAAATAAVVSLRSEVSAPLAGKGPGAATGGLISRYRIALYPRLAAGHADWCTVVTSRSAPANVSGGVECGPAAPRGAPLIAGGGLSGVGERNESLSWLVVDRRVALVRLSDGRGIRPRADPAIPYGWRSVVWFGTSVGKPGEPRLLDARGRTLAIESNAGTHAAGTARLATTSVDPRAPRGDCAIRVL
jgi:hypothetical protein